MKTSVGSKKAGFFMIIKNGSLTITLDGKYGCGKTLTLVHAMNYALNNDFIIVYIPSGK